ncbi:MAG TPA: iron-containing redox enzyme family protein [Dongiaceae bacterium]|jgi:pyrroloquinoline quinone (PQQ) biosynthesis protein C|nr:iron-containing redox enzyme family protein [Dongiaceae bacterium]
MFYDELLAETAGDRQILVTTPIIQAALGGRVTLEQYVAFLTQAYHHVRHTVPLLMICAARLPDRLDWLRKASVDYIEDEIGHDEWILDDIGACGGDREAVRRGRPAMATDVMVGYAFDTVQRRNPLGFFGMAHVLEGTSAALASHAADALKEALGLPDRAFTYLTSHGALDIGHTENFARLMNRLNDADDRADVIRAAKTFFRLYGDIFRSIA